MRSCYSNFTRLRCTTKLAVPILILQLRQELTFLIHTPQILVEIIIIRLGVIQIQDLHLLPTSGLSTGCLTLPAIGSQGSLILCQSIVSWE